MATTLDFDRFCPTRTKDLLWNESAWFSFSIPERRIHGMVYYFFRPNMHWQVGGPVVWDDTGMYPQDCLFYDWHHMQPMPEDAQKFDFTAFNSLNVEVLKPLCQYGLRYDDCGFKLDLVWSGVHEPHHFTDIEVHNAGAMPENRMHLEQLGRVTGQFVLDGEIFDVNCYSLRDSSWGRREFDTIRRGSYFWGVADDDTAFHALTMGDEADQDVVGGFLMLDGIVSTIRQGRRMDTRMGKLTPDSFTLEIEDQMGRTARVSARSCSHLMFYGYPRAPSVWSLLEVDFGNGQRGWGDIQEFYPAQQFRKMLRNG